MTADRRRRFSRPRQALACLAVVTLAWIVAHAGTALVLTAAIAEPDAIVSLGSHEWERLPMTTRLALAHPRALVLLTVPPVINERNCYRCRERIEELAGAGIDRTRIRVLTLTHSSTYGEALAVQAFLPSSSVRRLLIVTSPYHTRRALATFQRVLRDQPIEIGIIPATLMSPARPQRWWLHGYDLWYVTHEWIGAAYYAVRYGVLGVAL